MLNIYEVVTHPPALIQAAAFSSHFAVIFTVIYSALIAFTRFEQKDEIIKNG
jgi:hypothetical protein